MLRNKFKQNYHNLVIKLLEQLTRKLFDVCSLHQMTTMPLQRTKIIFISARHYSPIMLMYNVSVCIMMLTCVDKKTYRIQIDRVNITIENTILFYCLYLFQFFFFRRISEGMPDDMV